MSTENMGVDSPGTELDGTSVEGSEILRCTQDDNVALRACPERSEGVTNDLSS